MSSFKHNGHAAWITSLILAGFFLASGCNISPDIPIGEGDWVCWDGSVFVELTGRIIKADTSEPLIEADVSIRLYDDGGWMMGGFGGPPDDGETAITVEDGRFSVEYPAAPTGGCGRETYSVPIPRVARVEVDVQVASGAAGTVTLTGDQIVRTEETLELGDIVVALGAAPCIDDSRYYGVTGRIIEEATGDPIVGAEIHVSLYDEGDDLLVGFHGPQPEDVAAITDSSGSFSLEYPFPFAGDCGTDLDLQALPNVISASVQVYPLTGGIYMYGIPISGEEIVRADDSLDLGDVLVALRAVP